MKLYVVVEKSVQLGFTCVRELVRVGREEVGKLGRGRLGLLGKAPRSDLFGSAPQAPPSRNLPRDPARRPRRGTTVPSSLRLVAFLTNSTVRSAPPVTVPASSRVLGPRNYVRSTDTVSNRLRCARCRCGLVVLRYLGRVEVAELELWVEERAEFEAFTY
ncbi:hypothetical protein BHE74_00008930 [Ensete ventricosum]|nr:hypothetical protein BHE74_00008930 [Ensete ventricosum]